MRAILFTLMWAACTAVFAADASKATVYKWVDENGVTHYSDQPHENAKKVDLPAPQTYSAPPRPARAKSSASSGATAPPAPPYESCAVVEPANDQTFTNTSSITASVALRPGQRPGDRVFLTLDGQRVPGFPPSGGQITISPVDRGTHSLQAVVQDNNGKTVCQSASVTFHVHQPSIQNPVNPVRPK